MKRSGRVDTILLTLLATLTIGGVLIFLSAAVGLLARGATHISSVVFNHIVLGIGIGTAALLSATYIDYRVWRPLAPYIFGAALVLTSLVFIPGLGFEHAGSKSWLDVFGFSFQPSEVLKVATVIFAAAIFSHKREYIQTIWGLPLFAAVLVGPVIVLGLQPDFGTLGVIGITVAGIFLAAGARWRDILVLIAAGLCALAILFTVVPHAKDRFTTFLRPGENQQAEGYQIKQSLIAIGSGEFLGRGFGKGVQKFTYLPEPMGDSIFAVAGEELGFVGASGIVLLFLALALRGFYIAARAPDFFGGLLAVGISVYLVAEAFINISTMLGLAPITGIPLTFVSQGGSAALASLAAAGLLLGVSRRRKGI